MRAQRWAALVAVTALTAAGCGRQPGGQPTDTAGAVAVIDLDEIAQRLGSDKQMAALLSQRQTALSQQLVDLAKSYSAQIDEQKAKLAAADAAQNQQNEVTVASWQQQANANLNKVKLQAEVDLQNQRAHLINQFRDQIKPAARRVAAARGLTVIVTKNDSVVFDYVSAADITDAVVDELLAAAPTPAVAQPSSKATPASSGAPAAAAATN
jgi:Skp family chaperone for outer membrane proteins